jgi:hypothetical protein
MASVAVGSFSGVGLEEGEVEIMVIMVGGFKSANKADGGMELRCLYQLGDA